MPNNSPTTSIPNKPLDVRLVETPAQPHWAFAPMEGFFQQGAIFDDPPINGGVIELHPAFCHQLLDMACAQGIGQIPPHAHQNDLWRKMGSLETDRHCRSPLLCTVYHRERP